MRLIDADAFIEALENADADVCEKYPDYDCDWGFSQKAIEYLMQNIPTVDAVEAVRCEDCRFCRTFFPEKQIGKEARQVWYCDLYRCNRKTDEYCSDGERREEA